MSCVVTKHIIILVLCTCVAIKPIDNNMSNTYLRNASQSSTVVWWRQTLGGPPEGVSNQSSLTALCDLKHVTHASKISQDFSTVPVHWNRILRLALISTSHGNMKKIKGFHQGAVLSITLFCSKAHCAKDFQSWNKQPFCTRTFLSWNVLHLWQPAGMLMCIAGYCLGLSHTTVHCPWATGPQTLYQCDAGIILYNFS